MTESDDDDRRARSDDDDDEEFDDGFGDDLMGDDADRARLASLNELERETIMLERAENRKKIESRRRILDMARNRRAVSGGKREELEALERIAEAKARKERSKRVFGDLSDEDEDEEAYEEEDEMEEEAVDVGRRKTKRGKRVSAVADYDEEAAYALSDERPATREQIDSITLKRHQLEAWVTEPYFENVVKDCLVRVGIGLNKEGQNVYRLVEVAGVADGKYKQYSLKKYEYLPNKPMTTKWLILRWGKAEKTFRLSEVSNSATQDAEWAAWVAHCRRSECRPVYAKDVQRCLDNLKEASNFRYTSDDVTRILAEKREKMGARKNLLFEKEQIKTAIAHAEAERDDEKATELRERLVEVDREIKERLKQRSGATQDALANINRRNEIQNSEKLSRRASEQVAKLKAGVLNTGEGDPFSRRPTRLTTYWDMGGGGKKDPTEASAEGAKETKNEAEKNASVDADEEDDIFLTAGVDVESREKELAEVLQQAHRASLGSLSIDLSVLDGAPPAPKSVSTQSALCRGAAALRSAYDAHRAEAAREKPPGRAFTVTEYLSEFT